MNVALIGHGRVGAIHARGLPMQPDVTIVAVFGPDRKEAEEFALAHKINHASVSIEDVLSRADLAIVCSPSSLHFSQGRECLEQGVNTLVEMPPCQTLSEGEELAALASKKKVRLQCVHTARYLSLYKQLAGYIRRQEFGEIQQISYMRFFTLQKRSWVDDALLHHAAHPLDLFLHWFGDLIPRGCVALPKSGSPQSTAILAELPNGAPVTITVCYSSKLPFTRLTIVGERHSAETDGVSYLRSDVGALNMTTPEIETYEQAIWDRDAEFAQACKGNKQGVEWKDTIRLLRILDEFRGFLQS